MFMKVILMVKDHLKFKTKEIILKSLLDQEDNRSVLFMKVRKKLKKILTLNYLLAVLKDNLEEFQVKERQAKDQTLQVEVREAQFQKLQ